jgi:D-threo-aldose 1-dehydrogenase|tara:strand:- start:153 stop:1196 length:1044 start_codon:yes stop_codon:yes gene_type:complete
MIKKRRIGNTDLEVSELSMGTAPIGGWPVAVNSDQAQKTLNTAWEKGIRYFDTAPLYGSGMAEKRLGQLLKEKNREEFVVATKIGRLVIESATGSNKFKGQDPNKDTVFDFSYDGTMRSLEESLKRLQLDHVDVLHLHDPDNHPDHLDEAKKGAIKAMKKLKEEKVVKAIGCGLNQNEMLVDLAKEGCFDCFLLAGRYTLLDQTSLDELIPLCKDSNISLLLGGIFNSGILIDPRPDTYFDYTQLNEHWVENAKKNLVRIPKDFESAEYWLNKAYKLKDACKKHSISLKKTAIQFPFANEVVASVILGMSSSTEVEENFNNYQEKIPLEFWKKIKQDNLIDQRSPIA